eukprot:gene37065-53498_t
MKEDNGRTEIRVRNATGLRNSEWIRANAFRHADGVLCGDTNMRGCGSPGLSPPTDGAAADVQAALGDMSQAAKHGAGGRACAACGKRCRGCRKAYYCGVECARKHWDQHKADCRRRQPGAAAAPPDDDDGD